jgi:hypothetical protein
MIRTILSIAVLSSFVTATLQAEPPSKKETTQKSKPVLNVAPTAPLKEGWSLVKGVWTHSDGYQFVKGQVQRVGNQTHKKPPKPPTKAEMDVAMKKPSQNAVDPTAAKTAEREKNLSTRPAPQTGTHL